MLHFNIGGKPSTLVPSSPQYCIAALARLILHSCVQVVSTAQQSSATQADTDVLVVYIVRCR